MPRRAYGFVAQVLNAHGLWTEGCSGFFTRGGFKTISMELLEAKLREAGYEGGELTLLEFELSAQIGWIMILFDRRANDEDFDIYGHARRLAARNAKMLDTVYERHLK